MGLAGKVHIMDSRFDIKFTELAKQEGIELFAEGYGIRFAVSRSGCCAINVSLYPDAKKEGDTVIDIEGVPLFVKDDIPEMKWFGLIDYKPKGLHKGFQWKFGRKAGK